MRTFSLSVLGFVGTIACSALGIWLLVTSVRFLDDVGPQILIASPDRGAVPPIRRRGARVHR